MSETLPNDSEDKRMGKHDDGSLLYCMSCGYELHRLETSSCPECGRIFDINDARSVDYRKSTAVSRSWFKVAVIGVLIAIGLAFIVMLFLVLSRLDR